MGKGCQSPGLAKYGAGLDPPPPENLTYANGCTRNLRRLEKGQAQGRGPNWPLTALLPTTKWETSYLNVAIKDLVLPLQPPFSACHCCQEQI